jgi:hypothetical protein
MRNRRMFFDNIDYVCKTIKMIKWDSNVTWSSTWFEWSSYLIWWMILRENQHFINQFLKHHRAEFQLRTIYVRSLSQVGFINPSLWELLINDVINILLWEIINFSLWDEASHHLSNYLDEILLANKRSFMPQTMSWRSCLDKFYLTMCHLLT